MSYYLKHFFDPDFDYRHLRPREDAQGHVDHRKLGYVQNVVEGQTLAEWRPAEESPEGRFLYEEKVFPAGQGVGPDPEAPDRLVALVNGYVWYEDGLIHVKDRLNVRRDVDYHTGDIDFVGDVVLHHGVRRGFSVTARNIIARESVGGVNLRGTESIILEKGFKGGHEGCIDSGGNVRVNFCEYGTIRARGNILVEEACLHCRLLAGARVAVKGRFTGGELHAGNDVLMGELGGGLGAETQVVIGYDPFLLDKAERVDDLIEELVGVVESPAAEMDAETMRATENRIQRLVRLRKKLWNRVEASGTVRSRRILVTGRVHPGVELTIGRAYHKVHDYLDGVCFYREGLEVKTARIT
jgi:uncharacterized protein (DUF342 family)